MSLTVRPGGKLCFSLSAFSRSFTQSVYRYLLQRTLNFTTSLDFLILTAVQLARSTSESAASNRPGPTGELRVPEPHGEAPRATQLPEGSPGSTPVQLQGSGAHLASFLRAVSRKSLISEICFGCHGRSAEVRRSQGQAEPDTHPHGHSQGSAGRRTAHHFSEK